MINGNDDITTMCVVATAVNTVWQWIVVTVSYSLTLTLPKTQTF